MSRARPCSSARCPALQFSRDRRQRRAEGRGRAARLGRAACCGPRSSSPSSRSRWCCWSARRCSCAASGGCSTSISGSSRHSVLTARLWLPQPNEPQRTVRTCHASGARGRLRRDAAPRAHAARRHGRPRPPACCRSTARAAQRGFTIEGHETDDRSRVPTTQVDHGVGRLLRADGCALLRGRTFTEQDDVNGAAVVVVITDSLARAAGPGEDPIGTRLHFGRPAGRRARG